MVNLIKQIINTDRTPGGASLQVMQLSQNFLYEITFTQIRYRRNNLKVLRLSNSGARKNCLYQWLGYLSNCNLYNHVTVFVARLAQKTNSHGKSPAETRREDWRYQRYTEKNQQNSSEDINHWWKLYRSILGKYRYTSLKLAVGLRQAQHPYTSSSALMAYLIANFRASNPLGIGSREKKEQQCHKLWQRQTIS